MGLLCRANRSQQGITQRPSSTSTQRCNRRRPPSSATHVAAIQLRRQVVVAEQLQTEHMSPILGAAAATAVAVAAGVVVAGVILVSLPVLRGLRAVITMATCGHLLDS